MGGEDRKYDVVIFGATGFTGQFVVEEVVRLLRKETTKKFTWAVAGRSQSKLSATLNEVAKLSGQDLSHVDSIIADVDNLESLRQMARQCKIIVNTVGPFLFFGDNVLKACVLEKTHHLDISGEPHFLEETQVKYHKDAEKEGIYIIGSCGFDCIPSDVGTTHLQKNFDGDLESVEVFFKVNNEQGKKPKIHYGTYQSAIHCMANTSELEQFKSQLFPKPFPTSKYAKKQLPIHYNKEMKGWYVPFLGFDEDVIRRSQYHFYHQDRQRPAAVKAYADSHNVFFSILALMAYFIFGFLTKFKPTRYVLENYPKLCTAGVVSHEGPTKEEAKAVRYSVTLIGEGFTEKLTDPSDQHVGTPDKKMKLLVEGRDPGYSGTAMMLVQSALTILHESDKMPSNGGVYPPGAAFAKTTLVERLNSNGLTFTFQPIS